MAPSLARLVDPHASAAPNRPALVVHDGRVITYGDLAGGRDALAGRMSEARLGGERVALMLPNGPTTVLAYLACFASGAVAAPLNARYAPPEVERALRHLRPRWLIVQDTRLPLLAQVDPAALAGVRVLVAGHADGHEPLAPLLEGDAAGALPGPAPDHPAVIFSTSGSTGSPKGVVHSHGSALAMLTSTSQALGDVGPGDASRCASRRCTSAGFAHTSTCSPSWFGRPGRTPTGSRRCAGSTPGETRCRARCRRTSSG